MSKLNELLTAAERGDPQAAEGLLPLVYDELKQLASLRLAREYGGGEMATTSLVHEAYLRLTGGQSPLHFQNQRHFLCAAAEAMKRILVDRARRRAAVKRGGGKAKLDLDRLKIGDPLASEADEEILALGEALEQLALHDREAADLVKLRFFGGFKHYEAAEILGLSRRSADNRWLIAKAWLYQKLAANDGD